MKPTRKIKEKDKFIVNDNWASTDGTECYFFIDAPLDLLEGQMDRFNLTCYDPDTITSSEIQVTLNTTNLNKATAENITEVMIGPVVEENSFTEVADLTNLEISDEEAEILLEVIKRRVK